MQKNVKKKKAKNQPTYIPEMKVLTESAGTACKSCHCAGLADISSRTYGMLLTDQFYAFKKKIKKERLQSKPMLLFADFV